MATTSTMVPDPAAVWEQIKAEAPPQPSTIRVICGECEKPEPGEVVSTTLCAMHESRRLEAARRAEGQHRCNRCDYYAAMDRPCPFSPLGREIAIDYGYAK